MRRATGAARASDCNDATITSTLTIHLNRRHPMEFTEFKAGPARSVFAGLGRDWAAILEEAWSF